MLSRFHDHPFVFTEVANDRHRATVEMVPPTVVQGTATRAVVTLIMAARPQTENVARTLPGTRPAPVPSLARVVPALVIAEAPVIIAPDRIVTAVRVHSDTPTTTKRLGVSPYGTIKTESIIQRSRSVYYSIEEQANRFCSWMRDHQFHG